MDDHVLEAELKDQILAFSKAVVDADLLEYYGGNMSVRIGDDDMLITRTHTKKLELTHDDIVRTAIGHDDENAATASSALEIHRAIYQQTDARAVLHAHPKSAVTLSFFCDVVEPLDENGILYLGREIRVVAAPALFAWNLVANEIADALVDGRAVIHKWHGSFTKGEDLAEAFHRTRALDFVCEQVIRVEQLRSTFGVPTPVPVDAVGVLGGLEGRVVRRV